MDNLETLALRAAKGDKAAFEQIYRETYRSVYLSLIHISEPTRPY